MTKVERDLKKAQSLADQGRWGEARAKYDRSKK